MRKLFVATLLLTASTALANDWGPWPSSPDLKTTSKTVEDFHPLKWGIRFFQKYISPVDGPRCPMTPTCSSYALQALEKHGPAIGTFMTVDRLFHESDPREQRHPVRYGDRVRYRDPLENNDFWFSK